MNIDEYIKKCVTDNDSYSEEYKRKIYSIFSIGKLQLR